MASRSNYYEFQDAKVAIAMELVKRGWKLYGFHEDESDSMTDYWSPARWDGVATKDGYVVVVDRSWNDNSGKEIKEYSNSAEVVMSTKIRSLINRLQEVRQDRGASEAEEETAKRKIEQLKQKTEAGNKERFTVVDHYPVYQVNPPRMSWHVEKDGVIIAKGNGIAKFSRMDRFDKEYEESVLKLYEPGSYRYENAAEMLKTAKAFEKFLNRIDSAAGAMIGGNGDAYVYENIIVQEVKKENKAVEVANGSIKDGQCFILKTNFNYGCYKGLIYRIHEMDCRGKKYYRAYKLNGKLTKECTGKASSNNHWGCFDNKFLNWIAKGAIAWCEIQEVQITYDVQKCVKKKIS